MYGKLFERMYTGSMMGSGAMMFAVWPYVIAHMKPNRDRTQFTVELNSALMALLIGESEEEISEVIKQCCEPDPKSRTPEKGGRKLVKLSEYLYEVVNGNIYDQIRRAEDMRESNRLRQKKFYDKKTTVSQPQEPVPVAPQPEPKPRFQKPTLQELIDEGMPKQEAGKFLNYYDSVGWVVGKKTMKDWRAACRGWLSRNADRNESKDRKLTEAEILEQAMQ